MLTIVPVDEERRQTLTHMYEDLGVQGMIAQSGDHEEGAGAYIVRNDVLWLLDLWADDLLVQDGLLRAILNTGRSIGAKRASCGRPQLAMFLQTEGFLSTADGMSVDIFDFFAQPCRSDIRGSHNTPSFG